MYRINLPLFEGPLDLLLFFIRRDEINIYDIPIASITTEFISYLNAMKELDLEIAAEFIYMASLLISIKSQMLLPKENDIHTEIEDYDPRTELVNKLLEYKQIKDASLKLQKKEDYRRRYFERRVFEDIPEGEVIEHKASLFNLMQAYLSTIEKSKNILVHTVEKTPVTQDEQEKKIIQMLNKRERFPFSEIIFTYRKKIYIVVTFLAILELAKDNKVSLFVETNFKEFWITRPKKFT